MTKNMTLQPKQEIKPQPHKRFEVKKSPVALTKTVTFIDLFAGLGGTRIGFEQACRKKRLKPSCVFTSEIKESALAVYTANFEGSEVHGDITTIDPYTIPDFDFLLAGFPCQPFSSAGRRKGFLDERGGLFFTIHQILSVKKPQGFLLENVEGLVSHNHGKTLDVIISQLESLNYQVSWEILDASNFGVPQKRKRVYIVGHQHYKPELHDFVHSHCAVNTCIDYHAPVNEFPFAELLAEKFTPAELYGKAIKDKRGGKNNIHSWDLEIKGSVNQEQKKLLELILKKRRYKKWAEAKGIDWMDGMPLTLNEIKTFYHHPELEKNLDDLTRKGYLRFEHPKKRIEVDGVAKRVPHTEAEKGYNIVAGKLSFPLTKILDPHEASPTIVATEVGKIGIATPKGVRSLTVREGLALSGFPDSYQMPEQDYSKAFDLIGNTVMPPVIKQVALKLLK